MDLVLKLREMRKHRRLSQRDVARISGVGEKTISSFETGQRIPESGLLDMAFEEEGFCISARRTAPRCRSPSPRRVECEDCGVVDSDISKKADATDIERKHRQSHMSAARAARTEEQTA